MRRNRHIAKRQGKCSPLYVYDFHNFVAYLWFIILKFSKVQKQYMYATTNIIIKIDSRYILYM